MDWEDYEGDWDEIKENIFAKLEYEEDKSLKKYLLAMAENDLKKASRHRYNLRAAQNTLFQLRSLSEENLKRMVFGDYEEDDDEDDE